MRGVPMLSEEMRLTVSLDDREKMFKHITPSDKYIGGKSSSTAEPDGMDDASSEEDHDNEATEPGIINSKVVLFHMELHPKVARHWVCSMGG